MIKLFITQNKPIITSIGPDPTYSITVISTSTTAISLTIDGNDVGDFTEYLKVGSNYWFTKTFDESTLFRNSGDILTVTATFTQVVSKLLINTATQTITRGTYDYTVTVTSGGLDVDPLPGETYAVNITGTVTDINGNAIYGAKVGLARLMLNATVSDVTTDINGNYQLTGTYSQDSIQIQCSASGYISQTVTVQLGSLLGTTQNFTLEQSSVGNQIVFSCNSPSRTGTLYICRKNSSAPDLTGTLLGSCTKGIPFSAYLIEDDYIVPGLAYYIYYTDTPSIFTEVQLPVSDPFTVGFTI